MKSANSKQHNESANAGHTNEGCRQVSLIGEKVDIRSAVRNRICSEIVSHMEERYEEQRNFEYRHFLVNNNSIDIIQIDGSRRYPIGMLKNCNCNKYYSSFFQASVTKSNIL